MTNDNELTGANGILTQSQNEKLNTYGWLETSYRDDIDLLSIARRLGEPIPSRTGGQLIDKLSPVDPNLAQTKSMSGVHGMGSFPFHTDSANMLIPPRYILLGMRSGISMRPTLLLDIFIHPLTDEQAWTLYHSVWLVNGGHGRFFASILNNTLVPGRSLVRYDRNCMRPAHIDFLPSQKLFEQICAEGHSIEIKWDMPKLIIIDNWRMVHARGIGTQDDNRTRVLERVTVALEKL